MTRDELNEAVGKELVVGRRCEDIIDSVIDLVGVYLEIKYVPEIGQVWVGKSSDRLVVITGANDFAIYLDEFRAWNYEGRNNSWKGIRFNEMFDLFAKSITEPKVIERLKDNAK